MKKLPVDVAFDTAQKRDLIHVECFGGDGEPILVGAVLGEAFANGGRVDDQCGGVAAGVRKGVGVEDADLLEA